MKTTSTIKSEAKGLLRGHFADALKIYWPILAISLISGFLTNSHSATYNLQQMQEAGESMSPAMISQIQSSSGSGLLGMLLSAVAIVLGYGAIISTRKLIETKSFDQNIFRELTGERSVYALISGLMVSLMSSAIGIAVGMAVVFIVVASLAGLGEAGIGLSFLLILAIIPAVIYFTLPLEYVNYVLTDWDAGIGEVPSDYGTSKAGDVWAAIKESYRRFKGKRMDAFFFDLSFIGWYFLIVFSLGIAGLWFVPYYTVAKYGYYRDRLSA